MARRAHEKSCAASGASEDDCPHSPIARSPRAQFSAEFACPLLFKLVGFPLHQRRQVSEHVLRPYFFHNFVLLACALLNARAQLPRKARIFSGDGLRHARPGLDLARKSVRFSVLRQPTARSTLAPPRGSPAPGPNLTRGWPERLAFSKRRPAPARAPALRNSIPSPPSIRPPRFGPRSPIPTRPQGERLP